MLWGLDLNIDWRRAARLAGLFLALAMVSLMAFFALKDQHDQVCGGHPKSEEGAKQAPYCKGKIACLSVAFGIMWCINVFAIYNFTKIRNSRAAREHVLMFELFCFLMSIIVISLTFYASPRTEYGVGLSVMFIVWGWLMEVSLGLKTHTDIALTMVNICHSFILEQARSQPKKLAMILIPLVVYAGLRSLKWKWFTRSASAPERNQRRQYGLIHENVLARLDEEV